MKGVDRDDAANALADDNWMRAPPPKGEGPDAGDPQAEDLEQGEGPNLEDEDEGRGLGPPSGRSDGNEEENSR